MQKMPLNKFALTYAFICSMTSMLIGYNIGEMKGGAIYMKESQTSHVQVEVLTWITNIFSLLATLKAGQAADWMGRRYAIMSGGAIFFIGRLIMAFSRNFAVLLLGRLFANIGVGCALIVSPVYIAEISPASSRGKFTSLPEVFLNVGTILGYISNYHFSKVPLKTGWRVMLHMGAASSYLLAIGVLFIPESPRWLIMEGQLHDAMIVLKKVCDSSEEAVQQHDSIKKDVGIPPECNDNDVSITHKKNGKNMWQDLLLHPTRPTRRMLICSVGMYLFRQACSVETVLQSPNIFQRIGITDSDLKLLSMIIVDLLKIVGMLISTVLLDWVGRRLLMLFSVGGIFLSLVFLTIFLPVVEQNDTGFGGAVITCTISALFYVGFFSLGLGPVTSVYSAEIFPLSLRAQGTAIGVAVNQVMTDALSKTFLWLCKTIGFGGTALLFAVIASLMWLLFYNMMPETLGLTLEVIGQLFGQNPWRSPPRDIEVPRIDGSNSDATISRTSSGSLLRPSDRYMD